MSTPYSILEYTYILSGVKKQSVSLERLFYLGSKESDHPYAVVTVPALTPL